MILIAYLLSDNATSSLFARYSVFKGDMRIEKLDANKLNILDILRNLHQSIRADTSIEEKSFLG